MTLKPFSVLMAKSPPASARQTAACIWASDNYEPQSWPQTKHHKNVNLRLLCIHIERPNNDADARWWLSGRKIICAEAFGRENSEEFMWKNNRSLLGRLLSLSRLCDYETHSKHPSKLLGSKICVCASTICIESSKVSKTWKRNLWYTCINK